MSDLVIPKLETVEEVESFIDEQRLKLLNEINNIDEIGIKTRADMLGSLSELVVEDDEVVDEIVKDYADIFELEETENEIIGSIGLDTEDESNKFTIKQTISRFDSEFFDTQTNGFERELISKERNRMLAINQHQIIKQQQIIQEKLDKEMRLLEELEKRRKSEERAYELKIQSRVAQYQAMFAESKKPQMEHNTRKFSDEDRMSRLSELEKRREFEQKQTVKKQERRKQMEVSFDRYYIKETESNIIGFKQRKKRGDI